MQRYNVAWRLGGWGKVEDANGAYVLHADYLRRVSELQAENATLKAENTRLRAPLTHREWMRNSFQCEAEHVGKLVAERVDLDDIIAARIAAPSPDSAPEASR